MNRAAVFCLAAACFLGASPARASQIDSSNINWGYRFSASPALTPIGTGADRGVVFLTGSGASNQMQSAPYAATPISTSVWTLSNASSDSPQQVAGAPFALVLNIHDKASGITGAVTFTGDLNGNLWKSGSTLQPTFNSPLTESLHLGHDIYDVSFKSFTPPSGNGSPGQFVFNVTAHHNPEPSSLVLAAIGAPLFSLALRRRRRA
jgi:hypothetical protein